MNEQIQRLSHELRLHGIHANFESRAAQATSKGYHPLEFLHLLLEDERLYRKDRLGKSLTTRAKFRHLCDLEDWDASYDRGINKAQLKELSTLGFYRDSTNLHILGKTGEGKTQLAIAVGKRLCQEGLSVAFLPMSLLFEEVLANRSSGTLLGYLRRLSQTKVLIFDDWGLRNYTHEEATVLVEILEARTKKGPVIVTSQVNPNAWIKLFEDPAIAEAVTDRLRNPSQKVTLKGGSYRERLQPANQEALAKNNAIRH
jgi:DNA replication protein DnaC